MVPLGDLWAFHMHLKIILLFLSFTSFIMIYITNKTMHVKILNLNKKLTPITF